MLFGFKTIFDSVRAPACVIRSPKQRGWRHQAPVGGETVSGAREGVLETRLVDDKVASGSRDNAMDEIPRIIAQIRPRADEMRECEVQRKHLLVTAAIEMTVSREVLDGINNLIKISVAIAIARMFALSLGLHMGERGLDCLNITVGTREGEASAARRIVFAIDATQRTQDASDVSWHIEIKD